MKGHVLTSVAAVAVAVGAAAIPGTNTAPPSEILSPHHPPTNNSQPSTAATTSARTPVEKGAVIYSDDRVTAAEMLEVADAAAQLVRANGYRCDSVSAVRPFLLSYGYELVCNDSRYGYAVEDNGGRWQVTANASTRANGLVPHLAPGLAGPGGPASGHP